MAAARGGGGGGGDPLYPADETEAAKRKAQFDKQHFFTVSYTAFFKRPEEEVPRLELKYILCPYGH